MTEGEAKPFFDGPNPQIMIHPETINFHLHPAYPARTKAERKKEKDFLSPNKQVIADQLTDIFSETDSHSKDMILPVGTSLMVALVYDTKISQWKRVSPAQGWHSKDANLEDLCFIVKPSEHLSRKYVTQDKDVDIDPNLFVIHLQKKEEGPQIEYFGLPTDIFGYVVDELFSDPQAQFSSQRWGENAQVLHKDGTMEKRTTVHLKTVNKNLDNSNRLIINRISQMGMIALGGKAIPQWYREAVHTHSVFESHSLSLLSALQKDNIMLGRDEHLFESLAAEITKRQISSDLMEKRWELHCGFPFKPSVGKRISPALNLKSLVQNAIVRQQLRTNKGHTAKEGKYTFRMVIPKSFHARWLHEQKAINKRKMEHPVRFEGIEITHDDYPNSVLVLRPEGFHDELDPDKLDELLSSKNMAEDIYFETAYLESKAKIPPLT